MTKAIIIALLFTVALSVVGISYWNTFKLGATTVEKEQVEREVEVVRKQREIGARPPSDRDTILKFMYEGDL